MAYVARINIFPIKALDGVAVTTACVLPGGALADDRRFAIFDGLGQYVNGKRNPRVHLLRSSFEPSTQRLTIWPENEPAANTFDIHAQRPALEEWLSKFFGFPVSFRENAADGFPDDTDSPGPTLISTATLREVANWFGLTLEQARARFRTNIEVDGVPPFWEDQLYGVKGIVVRFKLGEVVFDGINPCQRCVVPSRDAVTGASAPEFAKRFVEMRREKLPNWAEGSRFNHYYRLAINTRVVDPAVGARVNVGDGVKIVGPRGTAVAPAPATAPTGKWTGKL